MRMLRWIVASLAAVCAVAPARASAQETRDWRSLVGCYREGDWTFALDSIPFIGVHFVEDESRSVWSSREWDSRYERFWRITGPDSIKVVLDDGLHGRTQRLAVHGDTLVGMVYPVTDWIPNNLRNEPVQAVRVPCPADRTGGTPTPDSAAQALAFSYAAAAPTGARIDADPWRAVAPLAAWFRAHPDAVRDFHMRYNARALFWSAATADVRANALDLVGTYRFEFQRDGGPVHVFYGRTEVRPRSAIPPLDTAWVVLSEPSGYRLALTLAVDTSRLPRPGPGQRHPRAYGDHGASNSYLTVRLPAQPGPGGTRRFAFDVELANIITVFYGSDPELRRWSNERYRSSERFKLPVEYGEFVVSPDGGVIFTQHQALAPGRMVTIRGERISRDAWQCTGREEDC